MPPLKIKIKDEAHWHELRKAHIGASEVGAIFGVSPRLTPFELWHIKAGRWSEPAQQDDRTKWGVMLEQLIGQAICEEHNIVAQKMPDYLEHPDLPMMGATLDFLASFPDGDKMVMGPLEIKNVDAYEFRRKWIAPDKTIEAPLSIELQLQHQMEVGGYKVGAVAAFVGGNRLVLLRREAHPKMAKKLRESVLSFWQWCHSDRPPPEPTSPRDYDVVRFVNSLTREGEIIDLVGHNTARALCQQITEAGAARRKLEGEEKLAKAKLLMLVGEAEKASLDGYEVVMSTVKREAYTAPETSYKKMVIRSLKQ